jgi:hypothetical protein
MWALIAPGESATAEIGRSLSGFKVGAVSCGYQLVDNPVFIAASDSRWWRTYPGAQKKGAACYSMHAVKGCEVVKMPRFSVCNSGVLGLEVAKRLGATRILLFGFDMRGTHFFGKYTNGLANTDPNRRKVHLRQYAEWAKANPGIEVVNLTEGSALKCFPMARLDEYLPAQSVVA